jgi:hypothetical protein
MLTTRSLATILAVLAPVGLGCGGDAATTPAAPFELEGKWLFLGPNPSDSGHDLTFTGASGGSNGTMVYAGIDDPWSSRWAIKTYDNALDHFQMTFTSGSGTYLPVGPSLSGTYNLGGTILAIQLAKGLTSYPSLGNPPNCTEGENGTPVPDCRLYFKQQ